MRDGANQSQGVSKIGRRGFLRFAEKCKSDDGVRRPRSCYQMKSEDGVRRTDIKKES